MTRRLYYADSHLQQFEATVVERAPDGKRIYLDRTAFYPTSGGQQFDVGALWRGGDASAPAEVVDVIDEGERIAHVLSSAPRPELLPGAKVVGQIDWTRRFDHMQQHTGQHLLSAMFQEMLGASTLSVHFGADTSTLDLEASAFSAEQIRSVEARANASVFENRPVNASIEDDGASAGLRKASTRSGPLRVVSIEGLDKSACGGTHVSRTGEIGPILLRKLDRVRKNVRVEFVCGGRATQRARADYELLAQLAGVFATAIDGLPEAAKKRLAELSEQTRALGSARESLDEYRARELYAEASRQPAGEAGLILAFERKRDGSLQELRGVAQRYAALPKAVLVAALEAPPSILLASAESSGVDAGALLKDALSAAGGRGGGSPRLAQGTVADSGSLDAVLKELSLRLGQLG